MHTQVEIVTPQVATTYLQKNTRNRPLNKSRVEAYSRAMQRGEWQFNGDPIRFSRKGVLIDGQHRLSAIVHSGVSQDVLIIRDLPDDTFKTIDVGAKRTAGDLASLAGFKNTNVVTSGSRMFLTWRQTGSINAAAEKRPTNIQILDFLKENHIAERAASYVARSLFLKRILTPSTACFLYLAFSTRDEGLAIGFLDELQSPTQIKWDSPVFLLRERVMQSTGAKTKLRKHEMIAICMKAFRLWCDDKTIKQLKVATSGANSEKEIYRIK